MQRGNTWWLKNMHLWSWVFLEDITYLYQYILFTVEHFWARGAAGDYHIACLHHSDSERSSCCNIKCSQQAPVRPAIWTTYPPVWKAWLKADGSSAQLCWLQHLASILSIPWGCYALILTETGHLPVGSPFPLSLSRIAWLLSGCNFLSPLQESWSICKTGNSTKSGTSQLDSAKLYFRIHIWDHYGHHWLTKPDLSLTLTSDTLFTSADKNKMSRKGEHFLSKKGH